MSENTASLINTILLGIIAFWLNRQRSNLPKQVAAHLLPQQEEQTRQATEAVLTVKEFRDMMTDFRGVMSAMQAADTSVIIEQRQQIADSNAIIASNKQDILALRQLLSDERRHGEERDKRLDTYRVQIDELICTQSELQSKVNSLSDALAGAKSVLNETQQKLEATQAELEATKLKLSETQRKLDQALGRIEEITRDRDTERTLAAEQKRKLEEDLTTERAKVESLQKQVSDQQTKIQNLESEVARLTKELAERPIPEPPPAEQKGSL